MSQLQKEIAKITASALIEDGALSDKTSDLVIKDNYIIDFAIKAKEDMVFCGQDIPLIVFNNLRKYNKFKNSFLDIILKIKDGDKLRSGDIIANGKCDAKLILAGERVLLNLMQHLSGIATITDKFVRRLDNNNIKILDTRKTMLNLRYLQKYAVTKGGGFNHRFNLKDMIMIKDNHIALSGNIESAIRSCQKNKKLKIEVECDNYDQVNIAINNKPDVIMLDNMSIDNIKKCIKTIHSYDKNIKIEVSGDINLDNINNYKNLDIDFISIGYLTHSVRASNISLEC